MSSKALALMLTLAAGPLVADEGMWLFNEIPRTTLEARYGFAPTPEQLEHLRLATVRIGRGGTGSFASAQGLVLTNHHVGLDCIQKLSTAERDLVAHGFVAKTHTEELACPDTDLSVVVSIERVTDRIEAALAGVSDPAAQEKARRTAIADLERGCKEATGLTCEVVRLFGGAVYDLYRLRRYTDVRLAFAPEIDAVRFGGDVDNFDYPRFSFDFALFRVWENGKPLAVEHHLSWQPEGVAEGEPVFAAGFPGGTQRLYTLAQMAWTRDVWLPLVMLEIVHSHDRLVAFSARGAEQERIALRDLYVRANSMKALSGLLGGLLDAQRFHAKAEREGRLRRELAARPELVARFGDPWAEIERSLVVRTEIEPRYRVLESTGRYPGRLFDIARWLVRLAEERTKADGERIPEYRESVRPLLEQRLLSPAPIHPELEEDHLTGYLRRLLGQLGPIHPAVLEVIGRHSPEEVAAELVRGTHLTDVAVRKALMGATPAEIAASTDPLIRFARALDPHARAIRERWQDEVDSINVSAWARIAQIERAVTSGDLYPDATGSLRLSFGKVAGYEEGGRPVAPFSPLSGLYQRAEERGGRPPYTVAATLSRLRGELPGASPVTFVAKLDSTGGNSGSPVVDREMRLVGVLFDGNLWTLANPMLYDETQARTISVDVRAMLLALTRIYPAAHLAEEIVGEAP
ncbi:MAG TPA: S46 family peptidase [Thermoanaerobaculia bacterium]|nr:S46 family peptidase [Thermoanaerobaculia bacterium]